MLGTQTMILLGAGASKPFGIRTLQEMTDSIVEIMKRQGYGEIVERIISDLRKFGMTPDFEAIFTVVEGLTDLPQAIKDSGPLTAYVCKDLDQIKPKEDLRELSKVFREFIYEECRFNPKYHSMILSTYDRLFGMMHEFKELRYVIGVENQPSVDVGETIVTTNYDMILESYFTMKQPPLLFDDGFKAIEGRPQIKELDLTSFSYARHRWILKLHGSIWQYYDRGKIFSANQNPETIELFPVKIQDRMMIYPTGEKPILHHPYFDFYNIFKTQKWEQLVAIGYSFRDEPVNIAIRENLEKKANSKLIVVNPNPEEVLKNLGVSDLTTVEEQIVPVAGEFGKEETIKKLELALRVNSRTRFFKRLADWLTNYEVDSIFPEPE
jgi:hypothetical protein